MNVKMVSLFCLFFMMTACSAIAPVEKDKDQSVNGEVISLNDDSELKHGQSREEKRKGLPAYWH